MNKVYSALIRLLRFFFPSASDRRFIALNRELLPNSSGLPVKNVLIQMPEDPFYLILFSSLVRDLKKLYSLQIGWIELNAALESGGIKNTLKKLQFFYRRWERLYRSNGGKVVYRHIFWEKRVPSEARLQAISEWHALSSKEDILKITYRGISIGDLIYDTYLRYKPAATVDVKDEYLKTLIVYAFDHVLKQEKLFSETRYDFLFTSYCSYIHHGVMARSALKYGVKVISFGSYDQLAKAVSPEDPTHFKDYIHYKEMFSQLLPEFQSSALKEAAGELETRFAGKVDLSTYYMSESAYQVNAHAAAVFKDTGKKRVVVFLHDFFDSPHIHRYMFYADFYDWIFRTLEILSESPYDVYIKPHPNGLPENDPIVSLILSKFPKVSLISKKVSNHNLIKEGFDLAVTVYGTLAHEFPYFGIPVLNAGDNPHINYDFCIHPRTRDEYEYNLRHLEQLPVPSSEAKPKIHEFYYMHNLYLMPGKLQVGENAYLNGEIRFINSSDVLEQFLNKVKQPGYLNRIDDLVWSSVRNMV